MLKKLIAIVSGVIVAWCMWHGQEAPSHGAVASAAAAPPVGTRARAVAPPQHAAPALAPRAAPDALERAMTTHAHDVRVSGAGTVTRLLRDDVDGARHQRFLVRTDSGHSLLVVHNIDIAPRVAGLRRGAQIAFAGEYVWNDRGGLIHWTHHDPSHHHADGFIRYDGHLYR